VVSVVPEGKWVWHLVANTVSPASAQRVAVVALDGHRRTCDPRQDRRAVQVVLPQLPGPAWVCTRGPCPTCFGD
jgi:hypothetical protein